MKENIQEREHCISSTSSSTSSSSTSSSSTSSSSTTTASLHLGTLIIAPCSETDRHFVCVPLREMVRDCLLGSAFKNSGKKSPQGEEGCNIRGIITGEPMDVREDTGIPCCASRGPGKSQSQCGGGRERKGGRRGAI
ncbi:hypothetical protein F7725_015090 [Dissostichus mawsoni]|uniref:Uncharacterized protein n=1 Tax=Dissostichus mawsoni TaxID=36200 RepID=A0A7J5YHG1_DISMA|nr:hypothetical protein F7725_015090 [Dissostichus mawsoni]